MGREIRRVPPNWEHPKEEKWNMRLRRAEVSYHPMFDEPYSHAISEWVKNHQLWEDGKHPDQLEEPEDRKKYKHFAEWGGNAPEIEYYRPDWDEDKATWYQVYETVSEGTPVTPPFETRAELIEYLVENGDFWDQKRREEGISSMPCDPWTREQAEKFVMGPGWAPSLVATHGKMMSGVEYNAMKDD